MTGRMLTVAESDPSGSAGIQADIKTVLALGGYATTAISCVLVQNAQGIVGSCPMEPEFIAEQMRAVLSDIGTDGFKIGYLPSAAAINAVADVLDEIQDKEFPVVVDPSIVARDGSILADAEAIAAWKRRLYIRTTVLTPNLREAEILTGLNIRDIDDMRHAADMMRTLGVESVVLKAGQAVSDKVLYFIADDDGELVYERPMLSTRNTLGAGCTLSAAIAISLAQGMRIHAAVERGLDFMHQAILHAPEFGGSSGPMNHAFDIEKNSSFFHPEAIKIHKV
jgi:hydroxymethylpyrimidine/phosphomethylpyrimidine kinase